MKNLTLTSMVKYFNQGEKFEPASALAKSLPKEAELNTTD